MLIIDGWRSRNFFIGHLGPAIAYSLLHQKKITFSGYHFFFCSLWQMGISKDNVTGLILAVSSSVFIGSSFIIKKMGLKKAGTTGKSAGSSSPPLFWFCVFGLIFSSGLFKSLELAIHWVVICLIITFVFALIWSASGGHAYLYEPWWWIGMVSSKWFSGFFSLSFWYSPLLN